MRNGPQPGLWGPFLFEPGLMLHDITYNNTNKNQHRIIIISNKTTIEVIVGIVDFGHKHSNTSIYIYISTQ